MKEKVARERPLQPSAGVSKGIPGLEKKKRKKRCDYIHPALKIRKKGIGQRVSQREKGRIKRKSGRRRRECRAENALWDEAVREENGACAIARTGNQRPRLLRQRGEKKKINVSRLTEQRRRGGKEEKAPASGN